MHAAYVGQREHRRAVLRVDQALQRFRAGAGRTGAAYAAQLGSMKVNQEIDALAISITTTPAAA